MPGARESLETNLRAVEWTANVESFLADTSVGESMAQSQLRMAIWAKQFETVDRANPALVFVREMQLSGYYVAALVALALYRPAAASMRAMFECALYYTYFRTHPSELDTLTRDSEFYLQKSDLIEYHRLHTPDFAESQNSLGLVGKITEWYKRVSGIAHGRVPGKWGSQTALSQIAPSKAFQADAISAFTQGEQIIHGLFLCTAGRALWSDFTVDAKRKLLAGLSGQVKEKLALDRG